MSDAASLVPSIVPSIVPLALERLAEAMVFGAVIGFERQWRQKMAGLRTNTLVAIGAAGFVLFDLIINPTRGSGMRIAAQVVSGVGFIGAGAILREGVTVSGLNTAATLWCSAMVGMFTGAGYAAAGACATAFIVLTNVVLRPVTRRLAARLATPGSDTEAEYFLTVVCEHQVEAETRAALLAALARVPLAVREFASEDVPDSDRVRLAVQARAPRRQDAAVEAALAPLTLRREIHAARWTVEAPLAEE